MSLAEAGSSRGLEAGGRGVMGIATAKKGPRFGTAGAAFGYIYKVDSVRVIKPVPQA